MWFAVVDSLRYVLLPEFDKCISRSLIGTPELPIWRWLASVALDAVTVPLVPVTSTLPLNSITSPSFAPIVTNDFAGPPSDAICNPPSLKTFLIAKSGDWLFLNCSFGVPFACASILSLGVGPLICNASSGLLVPTPILPDVKMFPLALISPDAVTVPFNDIRFSPFPIPIFTSSTYPNLKWSVGWYTTADWSFAKNDFPYILSLALIPPDAVMELRIRLLVPIVIASSPDLASGRFSTYNLVPYILSLALISPDAVTFPCNVIPSGLFIVDVLTWPNSLSIPTPTNLAAVIILLELMSPDAVMWFRNFVLNVADGCPTLKIPSVADSG